MDRTKLEGGNMPKTLLEIYMEDSLRPYSLEQARTARDEGIKKGTQNINFAWQNSALDAVYRCATQNETLIVDDVWQYLYDDIGRIEADTANNRVMGTIMMQAKKYRWIKATDNYKASARTTSHANPRRVWRSMLYDSTSRSYRMEL
jgi:hypothetical protein